MDFWTRLFGVSYAPRPRNPPAKPLNDPQTRLTQFKIALSNVERICSSNKRDLAREQHTLGELQKLFGQLAQLVREETRAPIPHPCVQHAIQQQIYTVVNRAAAVSFHEGCIHSAITLMAALVDSEEESFLTSTPFAKSLMRLVTRVVGVEDVSLSIETETFVLELLFTISAKIRLQPAILPCWFSPSKRVAADDDAEERSTNQSRDSFPLCYVLVDRIYHEGRIGDFARTGLLYIFEATGSSTDLENWIVDSSDVCTLMASGLGALYSQLSRGLSILYPDAVLPAALALSDYTTTHAHATAESAFSKTHIAHVTTLLSYLAFWQDILDHCKSGEVRQALLDHFQILFLQQLLYPSILESSDSDGGSSVAVLSILTAILESLEHPALVDNILSYLMATSDSFKASDPDQPQIAPASPTSIKRRQSLLELTTANGAHHAVEPALFNLVDLIHNSLSSNNAQTVFAALRLTSVVISRQSKHALGTMLKLDETRTTAPKRALGFVRVETQQYTALARRIHDRGVDDAFIALHDDLHTLIEARAQPVSGRDSLPPGSIIAQSALLLAEGTFVSKLSDLLLSFFTNSIDVNLALTEALISIACCPDLRLDGWISLAGSTLSPEKAARRSHSWQRYLDQDEEDSFAAVLRTMTGPEWPLDRSPIIFSILTGLVEELDTIKLNIPNLDTLISARKNLLQAASIDTTIDVPASIPSSPNGAREEPGRRLISQSDDLSGGALSPRGRPSTLTPDHIASPMRSSSRRSPASSTRDSSPKQTLLEPASFLSVHEPDAAATTDSLMKPIAFEGALGSNNEAKRTASLNHVLTNVIVLQEFILEITAILSIRASVLGEAEVMVVQ